jgi:uncharacterized protein (TIGR02145 family)
MTVKGYVRIVSLVVGVGMMSLLRCDCDDDSGTGPVDKIYRSKLVGRVVNKQGVGLAGVMVTAEPDGHATHTLSDGRFILPDLVGGGAQYRLHFSRPEYRDTALGSFTLGYDDSDTLDSDVKLTWRYGSVSGVVYLDNAGTQRAFSAGVEVEKQGLGAQLLTGSFSFPKIEPATSNGKVRILAALAGRGFGYVDIPLAADTALENVAIYLSAQGGSISGVVRDEAGRPVADVAVEALGGAIATLTDVQGRYVLNNIPSVGSVVLDYHAAGSNRTMSIGNVTATEGEVRQLPPVSFAPAVSDSVNKVVLIPSPVVVSPSDSVTTLRVTAKSDSAIVRYYWDYDGVQGIDDSTEVDWIELNVKSFKWGGAADTNRTVRVQVRPQGGGLSSAAILPLRRLAADTSAPKLLTGVVTNRAGSPLSGVSVVLKVANKNAASSSSGGYSFTTDSLSDKPDTLVLSKSGFVEKVVLITSYKGVVPTVALDSASAPSTQPEIVNHPVDASVAAGDSVSFTIMLADSTGDYLYQWQRNDKNVIDSSNATIGKSKTYRFLANAADDSTTYRCLVRNRTGKDTGWVVSNRALLRVTTPKVGYRLFYNGNHTNTTGSPPVDATLYAEGEVVTVKDIGSLELSDYTFVGWSFLADGSGTLYGGTSLNKQVTMGAGDDTLHAVWQGKTIKVTFDHLGGVPGVTSKLCTVGSAYGPLPSATYNGYRFGGWWVGEGASRFQITDASIVKVGAAHTLKALWLETVVDVDGNEYGTITIGNQVWTVENWRCTKYNDSTAIKHLKNDTLWEMDTSGAYCFYTNDTNKVEQQKWGALYNWYAVSPTNSRKIAPDGWRVPSDSDWVRLADYLIQNGYNYDSTTYGNKIAKALASQVGWTASSTAGSIGNDLTKNNRSAFFALPGGFRGDYSRLNRGTDGYWWSATLNPTNNKPYARTLSHANSNLYTYSVYPQSYGFSVRLVKDKQ